MRRTTKKLSGAAKDRFLRQWLATEPGLTPDAVERLARRGAHAISSLRVRRLSWSGLKATPRLIALQRSEPATAAAPAVPKPAPETTPKAPANAGPVAQPAKSPAKPATEPAAPQKAADAPAPPFDPYVFGLVPVLQREGPDGLSARLREIGDLDKLRQMARAQQIALPADMKTGNPPLEALAAAIAAAVAKRIDDRKAAAR